MKGPVKWQNLSIIKFEKDETNLWKQYLFCFDFFDF